VKRVFLVIFVFCLAGLAWAQEVNVGKGTLTFSGKVASGVFFDSDDAVKESRTGALINNDWIGTDGRVRMWNETDTQTGLRADLTASYIHENIGFRIRFRADNDLSGKNKFDPDNFLNTVMIGRYAYGWLNLFNEGVKFTGGFIDLSDNVWGTLGDGDWDIAGNGIRVELKPFRLFNLDEPSVGSLNIGAFFRVPSQENSNIGRDDEGRPVYRTITPKRVLEETTIGFRYVHPWFYASAQLEMDGDIDGVDIFEGYGNQILADAKVWSSAADEARLMFGAGFTLLPELVFTAEGNFEGLGNWAARGNADLRQTLSWTLFDSLTVGMKAKELIWGYDLRTHIDLPLELNPWMQFKPFVDYKVTPDFTAGLEAGFGFGHLLVMGANHPLIPPGSNINDQNTKDPKMFVNEKHNIFIRPHLGYKLKNGLDLKLWYKITFISYADLGDDPRFANLQYSHVPKTINNRDNDLVGSLTQHQVALEFIWTF
jgi:hypothetical protein